MTQFTNPTEQKAALSEKTSKPALDWATAEDAYHLIQSLLAQVTAANDLIVLLATRLGEQSLKGIVETPQWVQYQASRRHMEALQADLERFVATMQQLAITQPDCTPVNPEPEA